MDYETLRPFLIWPHGLFGGTVLLSGAVAIATKKGSPIHVKAGKVFFWAMLLVLAAALPLMILRSNTFLLGLTPITAYLVIAGRRTVWRRKRGLKVLAPLDRALALVTAATSASLAVYGVWAMTRRAASGSWRSSSAGSGPGSPAPTSRTGTRSRSGPPSTSSSTWAT